VIDAGIREMLDAKLELLAVIGAELAPDRQVVAEVECGREALAVGVVRRRDHVGADARFAEPMPAQRIGVEAQ